MIIINIGCSDFILNVEKKQIGVHNVLRHICKKYDEVKVKLQIKRAATTKYILKKVKQSFKCKLQNALSLENLILLSIKLCIRKKHKTY